MASVYIYLKRRLGARGCNFCFYLIDKWWKSFFLKKTENFCRFYLSQVEMIQLSPFALHPPGKHEIFQMTCSISKVWRWNERKWSANHHQTDSSWSSLSSFFMELERSRHGTCLSPHKDILRVTNSHQITPVATRLSGMQPILCLTSASPLKFPTCCSIG